METQKTSREILEKLKQIQTDINLIKEKLDYNEELTDWAKQELEDARNRTIKIPHEEVKKMILKR